MRFSLLAGVLLLKVTLWRAFCGLTNAHVKANTGTPARTDSNIDATHLSLFLPSSSERLQIHQCVASCHGSVRNTMARQPSAL